MIQKTLFTLFAVISISLIASAQNTHTVTLSRDQLGSTRSFTPEQMKQILERDRARVEYINSRINNARNQLTLGPDPGLNSKPLSREKFDEFKHSLEPKVMTLDEINRKAGLPEFHFPF